MILDLRTTYDILRSHLNINFKFDSHVPVPADYVIEESLLLSSISEWITPKIFENETFKQFNMVNNAKKERYKAKRRNYIFIIATTGYSLNHFKMEKLFRPLYEQGVLQTNNIQKIKDYTALRNAMVLISALKKENVHREVYLLQESYLSFEKHYRFMLSSHLNKYKYYTMVPPKVLEHHSGHSFVQYYPSEIIPGKLFLGDANHATQEYVVRNLNLTHIANITDCVPRAFEGNKNALHKVDSFGSSSSMNS